MGPARRRPGVPRGAGPHGGARQGRCPRPDRPEHHYHYDPAKLDAHTATTLAWLGDPAAAGYARGVLGPASRPAMAGRGRPRRAGPPGWTSPSRSQPPGAGRAAGMARAAVTWGLLVPSNCWRAKEVTWTGGRRRGNLSGVEVLPGHVRRVCVPAQAALPPLPVTG